MATEKLVERALGMAALVVLGTAIILVVKPFLSALLLAVILVYATWPAYLWVERTCGGRKTLAAFLMTALSSLVIVAPFAIVGATLADSVGGISSGIRQIIENGPPPPPVWLGDVPLIGTWAVGYWADLTAGGQDLLTLLRSGIRPATDVALAAGSVIGAGVLELMAAVFIAFFLYRGGRDLARQMAYAIERFTGPRVHHLLEVAGGTVTGVIYGILGTALAQGILAGLGFVVAGIPWGPFLGFMTFVVSVIPMGPPLVWVPVAIWLATEGEIGWAIAMAAWGFFVVSSVDNVLRPYLISRGSALPLVLVFMGVIGGVLAFGVIGIFIGPVLLALGYALMREWTAQAMNRPDPAPPSTGPTV
ncbi:AI-2E family transporter [Rhodocista pekingensis]|uniref:AI-2E family transporter n=1 Tax=Rhodocista pekingensis TaxID=201185 RepID=A0ABW2KV31_9PROT